VYGYVLYHNLLSCDEKTPLLTQYRSSGHKFTPAEIEAAAIKAVDLDAAGHTKGERPFNPISIPFSFAKSC